MWVTRGRRRSLASTGRIRATVVAMRPSNLDRDVVHLELPDHRDLQHDGIAGVDPDAVVAGDRIELAGEDRLG